MVIEISSWRGGQRNVLRIRIVLPIRLSWFWYRWKEEVHAVILSYSTSKSIDGARRYPHLNLKTIVFFGSLEIIFGFALIFRRKNSFGFSLTPPSWRDFNNHVHMLIIDMSTSSRSGPDSCRPVFFVDPDILQDYYSQMIILSSSPNTATRFPNQGDGQYSEPFHH